MEGRTPDENENEVNIKQRFNKDEECYSETCPAGSEAAGSHHPLSEAADEAAESADPWPGTAYKGPLLLPSHRSQHSSSLLLLAPHLDLVIWN